MTNQRSANSLNTKSEMFANNNQAYTQVNQMDNVITKKSTIVMKRIMQLAMLVVCMLTINIASATNYFVGTGVSLTWSTGNATFKITSCSGGNSSANPGSSDNITVCSGAVLTITADHSISSLTISAGGTVITSGNITLTNLTISQGGSLVFSGGAYANVSGTFTWNGGIGGDGKVAVGSTTYEAIASGTSWTAPAGVSTVDVQAWGGGGGGGNGTSISSRAGGGGGGAYAATSSIGVTSGSSYTYSIGAGGAAAADGINTTITIGTSTVTAAGGKKGASGTSPAAGGAGGTTAASAGAVTHTGGTGATSNSTNSGGGGSSAGNLANGGNGSLPGGGVAPVLGGTGGDGTTNGDGSAGLVPGGGGGGAARNNNTGGAGAKGQIVLTYITPPICASSTGITPTTNQSSCSGGSNSPLTATITWSGPGTAPTALYQWYYTDATDNTIGSATAISGATSSTYTPNVLGGHYYFCVGYTNSGSCSQSNTTQSLASNVVFAAVAPSIATTTPGSTCGAADPVTVNLAATTTTGTFVDWYSTSTGGSSLGLGSPFTSPGITSTTNFYVAAGINTPQFGGGGPTFTSGTNATGFPNYGLQFDVTNSFTLVSVNFVSATSSGSNTITLQDASGNTVTGLGGVSNPYTFSWSGGSGATTFSIALNWTIPAGSNYRVITNDAVAMRYGTAAGTLLFPFNISVNGSSYGNIEASYNAGSLSTSPYNFFQTWVVKAVATCESARSAVTATIIAPPAPSFTAAPSGNYCVNSDVTYTTESGKNNYTWLVNGTLGIDYAITSGGTGTTDNTVTLKWLTSGSKTVTVGFTDPSTGCASATPASNTITVASDYPVASVTPSLFAKKCEADLAASPDVLDASGSSNVSSYQWKRNGTDIAGATDATYSVPFPKSGRYTVLLTNSTGCSVTSKGIAVSFKSNPDTVIENPVPTASISGTTTVCENDASPDITFTGSAGTAPYTFTYTINGGSDQTVTTTSGNSVTISAPTSSAGTFTYVLVSVADIHCSQTQSGSAVITVNPPVTAGTLTGDSPICIGSIITVTTDGTAGGTFTSSDENVITIDANTGEVTGIGAGTATITYTVSTGCGAPVSSTVDITVDPNVNAGTLSGTNLICIGGTTTFVSDGDAGGSFSSSDEGVATVNGSTGVVTGIAAGTATITYTVIGCNGPATVTRDVMVNPSVTAATLSGTNSICIGGTTTFTSDGTSGGSFSSSDEGVAAVNASTGEITGLSAGTATITYTVSSGCGSPVSSTRDVTVNPNVTAGTLSGTNSICIGGTTTFASDGTSGGSFSSSDEGVATVNASTGEITGVAAGTATITYTVSSGCGSPVSATRSLTVNANVSAGTLSGTNSICVAGTTTFSSDGTSGGSFSSSDEGVATVNASTGEITGVSVGTATITYTVSSGCGSPVSSTRDVTVGTAPSTPASITGDDHVCVGASTTLSDATSAGSWSSSNSSVASINASTGEVTGVAAGSVTITYTVTNACGSASTNFAFEVQVCSTTLNLTALLEGSYNGSGMVSTLFDLGESADATATDTITVNLWSAASLSNPDPDYSQKVILHNDGSATVTYPGAVTGGAYYIAVKHRNSIETWSAAPVSFSSTTSYNFTTALTQAYDDGVNAPMKEVSTGVFAFYGGDVNQDGTVDGLDMNDVDNDASSFAFGYNPSDCTGDGGTDGLDMNIVDNNTQLFLFFARPY